VAILLVYDANKFEVDVIHDWMRSISYLNGELLFYHVLSIRDLARKVNELEEISIYCADFNEDGAGSISIVRDRDPSSFVIVIADATVSPLAYVRPHMMTAGLLLRPFQREQVYCMLSEVLDLFQLKERERIFNNELFVFSTREGAIRVPYSNILYFEARNKKIVLCTSRKETDFYATLEGLMKTLPRYFLRCHNGFIVNKLLVSHVDLQQNRINLIGGFQVPVSRSYRTSVREALT